MRGLGFGATCSGLKFLFRFFLLAGLLLSKSAAFSLLGPYASWMDVTKCYQQPGDIGGPMNIGEGYRWNMPVITYGFDHSFVTYFGSNGVAAVEEAIQMLNQLPPASMINLTNYPANAWRMNYQAQAANLVDLKSTVLCLLLEQMGLAEPQRYTFCVRNYQLQGGNYIFNVAERNFDPQTAQPSHYVNDALFSYAIYHAAVPTLTNYFCDAYEFPVDPLANTMTAVADLALDYGLYVTNFSRDDVGGIRYLLKADLVNFESLPSDVTTADTNTLLVSSAYRPGIEKIAFVPHPGSRFGGAFRQFTNRWTDVFYDEDDSFAFQEVMRVTTAPDILFTVRDLETKLAERTGSTNWINHADVNGNWGGAGPGVIQPGIAIALNNAIPTYINFGPDFLNETNASFFYRFGSFNGSTNQPIAYPASQANFQPTSVHLKLTMGEHTNEFLWSLSGAPGSRHYLQTTTNLISWTTLATLTNLGIAYNCVVQTSTNAPCRFFRLFPE